MEQVKKKEDPNKESLEAQLARIESEVDKYKEELRNRKLGRKGRKNN